MIYQLENNTLIESSISQLAAAGDKPHLCLFSFAELAEARTGLGISEKTVSEFLSFTASKFESHEGYDFIILNIPEDLGINQQPQRVCLYFASNLLVFACENNQVIENIVADLENEAVKNVSLGKIMHLFFDRLTFDDSMTLKLIEQEITDLEEELIVSKKSDFMFLVSFRKKLLALKLYYEDILVIYEAIEQNENELIDPKELRYFRILTGRANRLYNGVLNLRDYVTQVREAYQTQIDINLNSVMKVFTVITSIFFPLTLIVGWYGMNLRMPEFGWRYGYLFVIGISLATAVTTLIFFKKKKWF